VALTTRKAYAFVQEDKYSTVYRLRHGHLAQVVKLMVVNCALVRFNNPDVPLINKHGRKAFLAAVGRRSKHRSSLLLPLCRRPRREYPSLSHFF
jgi:hypothetical protein